MKIVILGIFFLASEVLAVTVSFISPCEKEVTHKYEFELKSKKNVGLVTLEALEYFNISFQGSEQAFNSMFQTPTGLDALEVISDSEMMAYGWCFSVNGVSPEVFPDKVLLEESDEVLWWFGYAHYRNGQWITQCTPSYGRACTIQK